MTSTPRSLLQRLHRVLAEKTRGMRSAISRHPAILSHFLIVAASCLAPVVLRLRLAADVRLDLGLVDLQGFLADLSISVFVAFLLMALARLHRAVAIVGVVAWTIVNYANFEHFRSLGSTLNFAFAAFATDKTFVMGTGLSPSRPWLLGFLVLLSGFLVWLSTREKKPFRLRITLAACLPVVWFSFFASPSQTAWRATHFIFENVQALLNPAGIGSQPKDLPGVFPGDLSGDLQISRQDGRPRNVIVLLLEGISGGFLEDVARYNGEEPPISMPLLNEISRQNWSFPYFIAHQRGTNRGEYSVLCGDLPRILGHATPKMSEIVGYGRDDLGCLPKILSDKGYATRYMQAAPLVFMGKERFMPMVGFEASLGNARFRRGYKQGHWGIDDKAFLEQTLDEISALHKEERPFFVTVLTVGTHHPYLVPGNFHSRYESGSFAAAVEYTDQATAAFVDGLRERGILEDTLVLISSDESNNLREKMDDASRVVGQVWGLLVAILPSKDKRVVEEPFMLMDLSISILDFLGIEGEQRGIGGRSIFRSYEKPRVLPFGNSYMRKVGMAEAGEMILCAENFSTCDYFELPDGRLFSSARRRFSPETPGQLRAKLRNTVGQSLSIELLGKAESDFILASPGEVEVLGLPGERVFGGQFMELPARTRLEVELEFAVLGTGEIEAHHFVWAPGGVKFEKKFAVKAGQKVRLRYHFTSHSDIHKMTNNLKAKQKQGRSRLRIDRAVMRFVPNSSVAKTVVEEFAVADTAE